MREDAATSIRRARLEDAPVLAAAERAIAAVPGRLASSPDEIDEGAIGKTIVDLRDGERGVYLVAEDMRANAIVGHAFVEEGRKTRRLKVAPNAYLDDVYMALWVGP